MMEADPAVSRMTGMATGQGASVSSNNSSPATTELHHGARASIPIGSGISANTSRTMTTPPNNDNDGTTRGGVAIGNSTAAQRHMERVLFNLHHRLCTFVLSYTSKTMRQLMEVTLLLFAICGFGALIMLHVTFVYRGPATINCSTKCLTSIPGFDPQRANITHIVIMDDALTTTSSSSFPSAASTARGLLQAIMANGRDDSQRTVESHVVFIGGTNKTNSIDNNIEEMTCESVAESTESCISRQQPKQRLPHINQIQLSYSPVKGYLLLPYPHNQYRYDHHTETFGKEHVEFFDHEALQSILTTQYVMVSPTDPNCFGDSLLQAMIWNMVGSDTVMINWLRAALFSNGKISSSASTTTGSLGDELSITKNNPAFTYIPRTQVMMDLSSLTQGIFQRYHHNDDQDTFALKTWLDWWTTKCLVILQTCFLFFSTTTLVSFTLRETQERMVGFTQELSRCVRHQLPLSGLITTHVVHTLLFVPIMVGMVFFLSACYRYPLGSPSLKHDSDVGTSIGSGIRGNGVGGEDAKTSSLLAFNVLSIVWVCEVFSVLSLRSWQGITFFPRIFFLLFCLFHIYHFAYGPFGFGNVAFGTVACFMLHSMLFFWHRYELPAVALGWVTIDAPRMMVTATSTTTTHFAENMTATATISQGADTRSTFSRAHPQTSAGQVTMSLNAQSSVNIEPPLSPPTATRTATAHGEIIPPHMQPSENPSQTTMSAVAPTATPGASDAASPDLVVPSVSLSMRSQERQQLHSSLAGSDLPVVPTVTTSLPASHPSFSSTASSTSSSRWFPFLASNASSMRQHDGAGYYHDDSSHPNGSHGSLVHLGVSSDGAASGDDNEYAFFMGGEIVVQRHRRQVPSASLSAHSKGYLQQEQGPLPSSIVTSAPNTEDASVRDTSDQSTAASSQKQGAYYQQHQLTPTTSNIESSFATTSINNEKDHLPALRGMPMGQSRKHENTEYSALGNQQNDTLEPPSGWLLPRQAAMASLGANNGCVLEGNSETENVILGASSTPALNVDTATRAATTNHENCYSEESSGLQAILEVRLHPRHPNRRTVTSDTDDGAKVLVDLPSHSGFDISQSQRQHATTVLPPSVPRLSSSDEDSKLPTL